MMMPFNNNEGLLETGWGKVQQLSYKPAPNSNQNSKLIRPVGSPPRKTSFTHQSLKITNQKT